jgi:DnaJ-class molecular chaperone
MMNEHMKAAARADDLVWCPACKGRGITGEKYPNGRRAVAADDICTTCDGHAVVVKNRRVA